MTGADFGESSLGFVNRVSSPIDISGGGEAGFGVSGRCWRVWKDHCDQLNARLGMIACLLEFKFEFGFDLE